VAATLKAVLLFSCFSVLRLPVSPVVHPYCPVSLGVLQSGEVRSMLSESSTLKIGDTAPQFELPAANAMSVSLGQYLALGPLVIEFLRGTW